MKLSSLTILGAAAIAVGAMTQRVVRPLAQAAGQVADFLPAVPAPRSGNILVRIYRDAMDDRLFAVAAGVAFYALLALVPSLAAAVSLFGLFANPADLAKLPAELTAFLPAEAVALVQDEAQRLASQPPQALSIKLGIALFLSLWGASAAVRATFDALNVVDEQEEKRSIVRLYATALGVTLAAVIVFLFTIALIGANPKFVAFGPVSGETVWLYSLLRWPFFFLLAVIAIAALYWVGPSRPPAKFTRLLPGAAFAALLLALGSWAFSFYVSTLGDYSATYGSLATVVVMMTWLWVSASVMLLGAQINYELTHRP